MNVVIVKQSVFFFMELMTIYVVDYSVLINNQTRILTVKRSASN